MKGRLEWAKRLALEPQEVLFLVLGASSSVALVAAGAPGAGVGVAGASLTALVLFLRLRRNGCARYLLAYILAWAFYAGSTDFVELVGLSSHSESLARADVWLLGQEVAAFFLPLSFWRIEVLSAGYMVYHVYLHWALIDAAFRGAAWRAQFARCLYLAFGLGFVGYYLYPAAPPAPLTAEAGPLTQLNAWINMHLAAGYDAFPSVHVLVTGVILAWDFHRLRWRFKVMVVPALLMLVSTMALRFHYAVDVLVSLVLVAVLAPLARARTPGVAARTTA